MATVPLVSGGSVDNGDTYTLCGAFAFSIGTSPSWTYFGHGPAYNFDMLIAGGSAIDGSEPTLFMGLYNFSAADPITRQNWDVGSAKKYHI